MRKHTSTHNGLRTEEDYSPMPRTKREISIEFDHDPDPDFSWLEQDCYNPRSKEYAPTYASKADIKRY